uniref:HECT and RLD domain containing E3 ubiquitin protein ligase 3 n=1 Tax=Nothobranchius furzeri TaxID=105023 RepID=A0A8C6KSS6_NOTFU
MLCWGNARDGQLGIGVERHPVFEPRNCHVFSRRGLIEVACGGQHTLFLLHDGSVYTCGFNGCRQLGHNKDGSFPELVGALDTQKITMVSCGWAHSMAVNEQGQVFAWGAGDRGQLGLGTAENAVRIPRLVKRLCDHSISQVMCGNQHCIALSRGKKQSVLWLVALKLSHPSLLSSDRAVPCHVKFLRSQKVVYISCGDEHTAALTKDGGLFTFGDGSWGQLGHGSTNNELLPRRVLELMGTEVSQVACGRHHTLALVPSSSMVYAFGCNSQGQLGTGILGDARSPFPIKTSFLSGNLQIHVNHALRLFLQNSINPVDFRVINISKSLSPINYERLNSWRLKLIAPESELYLRLVCDGTYFDLFVFSSDDTHFKTNPKIPGIDLNSVRVLFECLSKPAFSGLLEQVSILIFESLLIPQLPRSPPDVEAMRIYLILSEYPALQDSKNYIRLTIPLAMAILRLDTNPSKVLDNWWCFVDGNVFTRMVDTYKSIVVFMLTGGKTLLVPVFYDNYFLATLQLLEKLHKVNLKANHVEYSHFYIPDVTSLVDIQEDYLKWFLSKAEIVSEIDFPSVNLCAFPFILNAQAKTTMLQTDAELQMQMAVSGANLHNVFMLLTLEPHLARNPYLVLHVRRNHLVSDTLRELTMYTDVDLKKPLKVIFDGEEAVDAGGVTKEFFLLLLKELMDPVYGMFTHYKDSNLLWFSDTCFVEQNWFHLIGVICGLAIYNSTVVDLHFPLALYKKLLDVLPKLEDFKELSPTEARWSLQELLDYEGEDVEEIFLLNFSITRENYGMVEVKELVPGGESIAVDKNNRKEFVEAYLRYVFTDSVSEQYSAFSSGFLKVCGGEILALFQPSELMAMVVGNNNYNWEEMEKNAVYKGEFSATHPTVRLFWEVFHEFSLEKKKQFLLFLTGSDRIPIHGMESLRIVIQSTTAEEHYLPVAHTCYNLLDMPRYQTKEILRRRLTQAVEQYEGFSLV